MFTKIFSMKNYSKYSPDYLVWISSTSPKAFSLISWISNSSLVKWESVRLSVDTHDTMFRFWGGVCPSQRLSALSEPWLLLTRSSDGIYLFLFWDKSLPVDQSILQGCLPMFRSHSRFSILNKLSVEFGRRKNWQESVYLKHLYLQMTQADCTVHFDF